MIVNSVLIVNDSKFESIILKDMLTKFGIKAIVSNEHNVMQDMEKIKPSMVIVNYIMEDTTGDQLIEEIKKVHPETVCILSSSNNLCKSQFIDFSIDEIVKTPIQLNQIKRIIESYIVS